MTRDYDRDIRELAQAVATLEVVFIGISVGAFRSRPSDAYQIVGQIRDMVDRAVFERDGLDPAMLDRIADRLEIDHRTASDVARMTAGASEADAAHLGRASP